MIINILRKNKIRKLLLPEKIFGVYSIANDEGKILANIEAQEGVWVLKSNEYIEIIVNTSTVSDVRVDNFIKYTIKEKVTGETLDFIPTPSLDPTNKKYVTSNNTITIGNSANSDICYRSDVLNDKSLKLTKTNNHWSVENNCEHAYLNLKSFKKRNMFHGDYIFINGLKVIVINDNFIINNPNNLVTLNNHAFEEKITSSKEITYQSGVSEDKVLYEKDDYFNKAPRFFSKIKEKNIKISVVDDPKESKENPFILQVGPRMTMSIMSFYSLFNVLEQYATGTVEFKRIIPSIMSVVLMLVSTLMWPTITKKYQKKQEKKNKLILNRKYLKYLDRKEEEVKEELSFEKQILVENNIPLTECQAIIYNRKRNLWERSISDEDFLSVRLGIGNVKSKIILERPDDEVFKLEDDDFLRKRFNEVADLAEYITDAPMDLSLTEHRIVGIVGNNVLTKYFFDSIFLQLTTFHSYRDLKIFVITNKENEFLWDYLRIMPHCWDNLKTNRYFASTSEEVSEVAGLLASVFNSRLEAVDSNENDGVEGKIEDGAQKQQEYENYETYYLLFIDDLELARTIPIIKEILKYKTNLGFSIIIRNDRLTDLPSECKTFVDVEPELSGLFESSLDEDNQKQFKAEFNKEVDMYGCALELANIPIQAEKAKFELPSSVSFLQMYNVGKVEQLNSLEKWKRNNPVISLGVPVGINQDGELFKMDAHEKGFGPHGLVAGTTGSGKSEWIISYILSLAVNFHPDEVQFVLIDYKGGGLALSFENKELGVKLPHLAGTITNLDKSTINRALTSIEAELKARSQAFNDAREKLHESSMDIYKYQSFYRKGLVDKPMSHLFLISDEFAELKSQEPEFLDQLVSTARIGRSLGVHLILATQKPSGVVNDQIWSNSRFHICLRVQDKSDSQSMIKTADAAMLKTAGSFYLQVGYNEYYALGQSAYSGAKYYPSDIVKKTIDDSVQYIDNLGKTINNYELDDASKLQIQEQGEELLNVVSYISEISKQETIHAKQLWLPNVDEVIYLNDIKEKYNWKPTKYSFKTVIGEYDYPALQTQGILAVDFGGNTAIYGETGSGKENLLTTIIWSSITEHTPDEINYYILDFGAETLRMFTKFPHVGEVIYASEPERVVSVLQMIMDEANRRKDLFADYNGNYESYIKESGKTLPRWAVVINGWDVFNELMSKIVGIVDSMFRDCVRYGISFICATSTPSTLRGRRAQFFENFIPLRLANDMDYRDLTGCDKKLIPQNNFGRGIAPIQDDLYCEFQTALVTKREDINQLVRKNANNFASYYKTHAKSLPKIPDNVTSDELSSYITDLTAVPVGYNFHEKDLAKFDFTKEKLFVMAFDEIKNDMKTLYGFINILSKTPGSKVRVYDLVNLYEGSNLDIQIWKDKLEGVLLALKRDLDKRTIQQDHGYTFILGAGSLKLKLNEEGKLILTQYMDALVNANQSTTILVDSYQKLKSLKIEPWFARVNTGYGIWVGPNIDSQNLFNVKDISMEERKIRFKGMAYLIDNSDYTLIKTILDEE